MPNLYPNSEFSLWALEAMPFLRCTCWNSRLSSKDPLTAATLLCEHKLNVAPEAVFASLSLPLPVEAPLGLAMGDPAGTGSDPGCILSLLSPGTPCSALQPLIWPTQGGHNGLGPLLQGTRWDLPKPGLRSVCLYRRYQHEVLGFRLSLC